MAGSYRSDATAGQTSGIREAIRPQTVLAVEDEIDAILVRNPQTLLTFA